MRARADDARSNRVLMVMEYVEGGNLLVAAGRNTTRVCEAIARGFFRDAAQASAPAPFWNSFTVLQLLLQCCQHPKPGAAHRVLDTSLDTGV